jgi:DNA-directed RNA polymerase subunit RPC12/RpoP
MASTDDSVKCPKCGSTQLHAEKRGWRMTTGFIGSGKIFITCLKCGKRFKPGDAYSPHGKEDARVGGIALLAIVLVGYVLLKACS